MTVEIIVAIIAAVGSLLGVILTVHAGNVKHVETSSAFSKLTLYRLDQLEKKVELHNNAVERLFVAEGQIKELQHEMRNLHKENNNA